MSVATHVLRKAVGFDDFYGRSQIRRWLKTHGKVNDALFKLRD
jgi:hypothetical protein